MRTIALWLFSFGAIFSAILVITSLKPVNAILSLILTFINAVGLFILLGLDFIALLYCIIYIGAIVILFLFVIMLLNIRTNFGANSSLISTDIEKKSIRGKKEESLYKGRGLLLEKEHTPSSSFPFSNLPVITNRTKKNDSFSQPTKWAHFSFVRTRPMAFLIGVLYLWAFDLSFPSLRGEKINNLFSSSYPFSSKNGESGVETQLSHLLTDASSGNAVIHLNESAIFAQSESLSLCKTNSLSQIGQMLYKECGYEMLLLISLILLIGMIGAIVLTQQQGNPAKETTHNR